MTEIISIHLLNKIYNIIHILYIEILPGNINNLNNTYEKLSEILVATIVVLLSYTLSCFSCSSTRRGHS